jgi:hypothetical protein
MSQQKPYAIEFDVKYQEKLSRITTFFRILMAIPILILYQLVIGVHISFYQATAPLSVYVGGGFLFFPLILMILFRRKYPKWWFDWLQELTRFGARTSIYLLLLTDKYPSTDETQNLELTMHYPDAETLSKWLPLVKWLLAIPHYIVLLVLAVVALAVTVLAWISILITGRYPRPLFNFVVGYHRWGYRVWAYAFVMLTDQYPPFSLK